ncbi:MAG TPA: short-chain dehydrogenase/reductase [Spirochaetaceae bacterium]|nr:short-chain dehydrogenase/reductase [Spirochaetaceae bacterium]
MIEQKKPVVFISGASSGIGNACATFLAKKGCLVYGTSRKPAKVQRKADEFFELIAMDLNDSASIQAAVRLVLEKEGRIDLLLCNAGMGIGGPAEECPLEDIRRQMDTNFLGAVQLIQAVLPAMRQAGSGRILVTSSIGGRIGLPFQAFYSASKFALEGFVEGLRMEIKGFGVQAALIEPGDFRSGFTEARKKTATLPGSPYEASAGIALAKAELDEKNGGYPIDIARLVLALTRKKKLAVRYTVGSLGQRIAAGIKPILPSRLAEYAIMAYYGLSGRNS